MLKNLRIENYRILQQVEFQKLSYVNLLAGRNNVGKSTVLEAIRLFAKLGSPLLIEELLAQRDDLLEVPNSSEKFHLPVEHLFNGGLLSMQNNRQIYIGNFDGKESVEIKRSLYRLEEISMSKILERAKRDRNFSKEALEQLKRIAKTIGFQEVVREEHEIKESSSSPITGEEKQKLKITAKNSLLANPSIAHSFNPKGMLIIDFPFENYDREQFKRAESRVLSNDNKPITYHVIYVPTGLMDASALAETWDSIALSSDEQLIIDALKLIEPEVERISFIKNKYDGKRTAVIKVTERDIPVSIKSLGEGMSRLLQLILSLVQVKNGFLLIDEFENGLHYSVQPKVWNMLFILAKKFNIQIFATTHSKDTVESFGKIWKQHEDDGSFHRLSRESEQIEAVAYECTTLDYALTGDIEVR